MTSLAEAVLGKIGKVLGSECQALAADPLAAQGIDHREEEVVLALT